MAKSTSCLTVKVIYHAVHIRARNKVLSNTFYLAKKNPSELGFGQEMKGYD